jgi:hypothetical protein
MTLAAILEGTAGEAEYEIREEIRQGVANLTDVTNRHLMQLASTVETVAGQA